MLVLVAGCARRDDATTFGRTLPRHGPQVLWASLGGEPETLDPARCNESLGGEVIDNLFAGLMQYPLSGTEPVGDLARRWERDPDGRGWRFWLRPSGWSDGTPVTAHDFVAQMQRVLDPATASRSAALLLGLRGAEAVATGSLPPSALGVRAEGDDVLRVELERPLPYFLHLCAHSITRPTPRHLRARMAMQGLDPERWSRPEHVVSNGAYRLAHWRFKRDALLEKNAHYWDALHVPTQQVRLTLVENADAAVQLYRAAELDVHAAPLPPAYVQALAQAPELRRAPGLTSAFYWLNTARPPLDDVRVRQALSLAIDRDALASQVLRGGERPSATLVPEGLSGYSAPQVATYDPPRARALLQAAGFGRDGAPLRTLRLVYNTAESNRQVAEAVQAMWRTQLGIEVSLENQEWRVYLQSLQESDFDVARMGWMADFPDADNFLTSVLGAHGGNNLSGWHDATFEAQLRAAAATEGPARLSWLRSAETRALAAQPLIPLYHGVNVALVKPYVSGHGNASLRTQPYKHFAVRQAKPPRPQELP